MSKILWKPGTMLYPLPAVMVTCGYEDNINIITIAWTGIICTNPAMTYISLRKERYSYDIIKKSGVFAINLATEELCKALDYCGVRSGINENKFASMNLSYEKAPLTGCPVLTASPLNIECRVKSITELGSHDMFLSEIAGINAEEKYIDANGRFTLDKCKLIAYSHGKYYTLGKEIGKFGFSVKRKNKKTS